MIGKDSAISRRCATFCLMALVSMSSVQLASADVSGEIFRDFDANGTRGILETGVGDIVINAFDDSGAAIGSATSFSATCLAAGDPIVPCTGAGTPALGSYTVALPAGRYRLEFSAIPGYFNPGDVGGNSATTVQFVDNGSTTADLALSVPAQYCNDTFDVATACYVNGDPLAGGNSGQADWLVQFPFNFNANQNAGNGFGNNQNTYLADGTVIGSTWGAAYQRETGTLFLGALMKRHSGLGTLGSGGIYAINVNDSANPIVAEFADLNSDFDFVGRDIDTGADPRVAGDLGGDMDTPNRDPNAFDAVGKMSLGDLELSADERTLWAINLNDSTLYELPVGLVQVSSGSVTAPPAPASVVGHPIGDPGCSMGEYRPFAVAVHDGLIHVGGVCSGESGGSAADLQAFVVTHDPAGADGNFTTTFSFGLDYPRGTVSPGADAEWRPWIDQWSDINNPAPDAGPFGQTLYPQPMLTDIEFDADGAMLLGFVDRFGHQGGNNNYSTIAADTETYEFVTAGDLLRACRTAGGYQLEDNASCPGLTPTAGAGSTPAQGPGGGEFYWQDMYGFSNNRDGGIHSEIIVGGLGNWPGSPLMGVSVFDPTNDFRAGGVVFFNRLDGSRPRNYEIFGQDGGGDRVASFGKAAGLGDVALLCEPAPIEIGNYIWLDSNRNGVQDPNETAIAGVLVGLYDATGALLATAETNASGQYLFSSNPFRSSVNSGGSATPEFVYNITTLLAETDYTVALFDSNFGGGPLAGLQVTINDIDGTPTNDTALENLRDSDGVAVTVGSGTDAASVGVSLTTGTIGANNHSFDFGLATPPPVGSIAVSKTITSGNAAPAPWQITIAADNCALPAPYDTNPTLSTTDGSGGTVTFAGLAVDDGAAAPAVCTYDIAVTPQSSYTDTTTDTLLNLTVTDGGTTSVGATCTQDPAPVGSIAVSKTITSGNAAPAPWQITIAADNCALPAPYDTNPTLSTTDGSGGTVTFAGLAVDDGAAAPAVCTYDIAVTPQSGYTDTTTDTLLNLTVTDGGTTSVGVTCTQDTLLQLGDFVWYDNDQDGIQDPDEPGVDNVNVELFDNPSCSGTPIDSQTTDAAGNYLFTDLPAGDYCLTFGLPTGWTVTQPDQGVDDTMDSDADISTAQIQSINLTADDLTQDVGIYAPLGSVSGLLFCDSLVVDSQPSPGEEVGNVTTTLYRDIDCSGTGDSVVATQQTAADGSYSFSGLLVALAPAPPNPEVCYVVAVDLAAPELGTCTREILVAPPFQLDTDTSSVTGLVFGVTPTGGTPIAVPALDRLTLLLLTVLLAAVGTLTVGRRLSR